MTQKIKLLNLMRKEEWICSATFHSNFIPEFRSLIAHMRKHEGYQIIDEPCLGKCGKAHTSKGLKRWKLVFEPTRENKTDFCASCGHYMNHDKNCPKVKIKEIETNKLF